MIETSYSKLFSSIVTSTIWREDDKTRIVWITLLALKNRHGEVSGSIPGLAAVANVSVPDCESAINKLLSPDPYSRSKEFEGRRIEAIDGGWKILNHAKYRNAMSEDERRAYQAAWQRDYRKRQSVDKSVDKFTSTLTQAEAEAEAEAEAINKKQAGPHVNGNVSGAQLVVFSKEFDRVDKRISELRDSYADHQSWSRKDADEIKLLRARRKELRKLMGVSI